MANLRIEDDRNKPKWGIEEEMNKSKNAEIKYFGFDYTAISFLDPSPHSLAVYILRSIHVQSICLGRRSAPRSDRISQAPFNNFRRSSNQWISESHQYFDRTPMVSIIELAGIDILIVYTSIIRTACKMYLPILIIAHPRYIYLLHNRFIWCEYIWYIAMTTTTTTNKKIIEQFNSIYVRLVAIIAIINN